MSARMLIRLAVYLIVYLGVPVVASKATNSTVGAVLSIVYIFVLIPVGILRMIEFYRTNDGSTKRSQVFNALFRVPLALFGLVGLVAGVVVIGWVLYNVFVERQKEYTGPRFVVGLGSFGVGVPLVLYGWFTLRSVVRRKEKVALSPEEQEEFDYEEDDQEPTAGLTEETKSKDKSLSR
jgi:uncharacterized membrane protein (DUF485 family)